MRAVSQTIRPLTLAVLVSTVVFVGSILSPSAATAATYYVATTGSDTNSGTQAAPFQTIQKAADTVNPGDRSS